MYILLCVLIVCVVGRPVPTNGNPGMKLAVTQKAIDYVLGQIVPFLTKEIQSTKLPDIHQDVGTPIGKISLDLTAFQLQSISLGSPTLSIVAGNEFQFSDGAVNIKVHGNWHYKDHGFPYPSDSGSFDLSCGISVTSKSGAVINPKYESHLQIISNSFTMGFNSFDLDLHGGASWLYNLLIGEFKSTIEDTIKNAVVSQVPGIIISQEQAGLDSVQFDMPITGDVDFSFVAQDIIFDPTKHYIGFGVAGLFHSKKASYTGTPCALPDFDPTSPMLSIFMSEYSVNSAGYVFDKEDMLTYVLTQKDIPPKIPIKLNTEWFKLIVPALESKYPGEDMQVTLKADPDNVPTVKFTQGVGLEVNVDMDTVFQVIDNSTKKVVDAFTISLSLGFAGNVSVVLDKKQYVIKGMVDYKNSSMTLKQSNIGPIDLSLLSKTMGFLIQYVITPLVSDMLQQGVPLPPIPNFTLVNPKIQYFNGYLEIQSDFTFKPPME